MFLCLCILHFRGLAVDPYEGKVGEFRHMFKKCINRGEMVTRSIRATTPRSPPSMNETVTITITRIAVVEV